MPGRSQVRTFAVDGSKPRYLGTLGAVSGLQLSWTIPGGAEQLTCTLGADPRLRTDATDPGRIVEVIRGGSVSWNGTLAEPQQTANGWALTANGSGTWGAGFTADFSNKWKDDAPDQVIANAVGRGLGWEQPDIGHPSGMFLGQPPDPGAIQVDAMMTQLCSLGGLTWWVKRVQSGCQVQVFPVPTTPMTATRLLVATSPAPRTLGGDINAIEIRYESAPDEGAGYPAVFSTTWATDATSIAKHGRIETFLDISNSGPMLAGDAQAIGNLVLGQYQRASYAGPFTVRQGELLTLGGQPTDIGMFFTGTPEGAPVYKLLMMDQAYGGEVAPGPVTFLCGRYEYDEDAETATITPFQSLAENFASLLAARASRARGRKVEVWRGRGAILWGFEGSKHWHRRNRPGWLGNTSTGSPVDLGGSSTGDPERQG
jgi:hypothetical protein